MPRVWNTISSRSLRRLSDKLGVELLLSITTFKQIRVSVVSLSFTTTFIVIVGGGVLMLNLHPIVTRRIVHAFWFREDSSHINSLLSTKILILICVLSEGRNVLGIFLEVIRSKLRQFICLLAIIFRLLRLELVSNDTTLPKCLNKVALVAN